MTARAARSLLAALVTALALPCAAQATAPERIPYRSDDGEFGALMWRSVLVTGALVILAVGAIYVMRRFGTVPAVRGPAEGAAQMVQTLRLGPRVTLHVVQFEGRRLLVGHSERGLRLIATGEEARPPAEAS